MAAIFPPADKGGVPPGVNVANGYTPSNPVIGEGPLYISPDCTTVLTADQLNAITSEILAAVDRLGFSYNSDKITNLGDVLSALFTDVQDAQNGKVDKAGDIMTGPLALPADPTQPMQAATKQYVDQGDTALHGAFVAADQTVTDNLTTAYQAGDDALALAKVERSGDTMTGPFALAADPTAAMQATTKQYVDTEIAAVSAAGAAAPKTYISDTPPTGTIPTKSLWWESDTGRLFIRYNDGDSIQWVEAVPVPSIVGLLKTEGGQNITGGFSATSKDLGALASFTVNPLLGNYQYGVNNGAFTITAPTIDGSVDLKITNGATAAAITFSGFAGAASGDALTTTSGHKFVVSMRRIAGDTTYAIKALQ